MPIATSSKIRVYSLYPLADSIKTTAAQHFQLICPDDEGHDAWRDDAEGIMVRSTPITVEDVAALKKCRYIAKHGVGTDRLALKALKAKDIVVMNTAGINVSASSERPC